MLLLFLTQTDAIGQCNCWSCDVLIRTDRQTRAEGMFVFRRCESHFAVSFANDRAYRRLSIQIQGPAFRDCFCALWHETLFHFALFKKSCFVKCVVCSLRFYTLVLVFYKFLEVHLHFALNVHSDVDDNVVVAISQEHWDCSRHFATRSLLVAFLFSFLCQ